MARRAKLSTEILVLIRQARSFDEDHLTLESTGGVIPNIGDKITLHPPYGGLAAYEVTDRIHTSIPSKNMEEPDFSTWALLVEEIESDELYEYDKIIREIHYGVYEPLVVLEETVDDLDRDNRDPAYWTPERKELLREEREERLAKMKREP